MAESMGKLTGRVAIVTGAASRKGIGFAICEALVREGVSLVLTDIAREPLEERATSLKAAGGRVEAVAHDVTDEGQWREVFDRAEALFGPVDILVNNAAVAILEPMDMLTVGQFERLLHVNLTGAFIGCKLAVERMRARRAGGSIVNISSVAGLVGVRGTTGYGAAKAGLRLLSKSIAIEAGADGIRCNSVHPGAIWTDIQDTAIARSPETYGDIASAIPLGRIGEPSDVAAAVLFLASDDSRYVTGAELVVDGGLTAG